jgi:hypothetical protein
MEAQRQRQASAQAVVNALHVCIPTCRMPSRGGSTDMDAPAFATFELLLTPKLGDSTGSPDPQPMPATVARPWRVRKRYSEFCSLHNALCQAKELPRAATRTNSSPSPATLPSLPPKRWFNSTQPVVVCSAPLLLELHELRWVPLCLNSV